MDRTEKLQMINDLCHYRTGEDGDQRWLRLVARVIGTYDRVVKAEKRIAELEREVGRLKNNQA